MSFDNLSRMFFNNKEVRGERPAYRYKQGGHWHTVTWSEAARDCEQLAAGLAATGIKAGDRVGLISNNRYQWALCDYAVLTLGAALVPIYPTLTAQQTAYIIRDSELKLLIVEHQEQIAKIETVRSRLEQVGKYFVFDVPDNLPEPWRPFVNLMTEGSAFEQKNPGFLSNSMAGLNRDGVATVIYTSGTTGEPKGAVLTHGNFLSNIEAVAQIFECYETDSALSFLPLSHVLERLAGHYFSCYHGACVAYAESIDTVAENMLEIRPTLMISVPRLYEKIYNRILAMVESGSPIKRRIFYWAVGVGKIFNQHERHNQKIPFTLKIKYGIAFKLVFHKLHQRVGGRLRYFVSGGAPLAAEIAEFFAAVGLVILEGYGLTETSPAITFNRPGALKFGAVGMPIPGVEVRIAEDGEILSRGPHIMRGYLNKEDATREVIDADGWFHTGDIGMFDDDGFLVITDRKKNILVTSGGKNVSPQPIENHLITSPYIEQALIVGDKRRFCSAVIVPARENVERWAGESALAYDAYENLLSLAPLYDLIAQEIKRLTTDFATFEQIKKFILVPEPFSQEGGELTPTLKVKRRVVEEKYAQEIEAMYAQEAGGSKQ